MTASSAADRRTSTAGLVTVVVTTRDVERTLEACLRSIRAQDHQPLELLVVDNSSTDRTGEIAARLADVVLIGGPERSAQRNLGVATARGEWLLWIDADMLLAPDVVSSALAAADRAGAAAVSIPETTVGPGFWTACRALERSCYLDDPSLFNPRLLRRELLTAMGGFDEAMAGPEDADLRIRLAQQGVVVAHASGVIDHDEGRLTLRDVLRKRIYYGSSLPAFAANNPGAVRRQAMATVRAFVRHRRRLAGDPVHAVGLLGLRALEAAAYAVGAARAARARRR
jgi:glycosyltransferase involved in cell wall biosynthesis